MIAWWTPAHLRPLFFSERDGDKALRELSGKLYPQPPLVFKASGQSLWIRALPQNTRPTATTRLCMAPYWNCYDNGVVCTGTMRIPDQKSVTAIRDWERSFFESAFSHAAGVTRHTRYRGGLLALWAFLQTRKKFLSKYLFPINQTLEEFVTDHDKSYQNQIRNQA
jgi:PRTRC genetic system protein B